MLVTGGYVELRKGSDGRRSRTWARITPKGRQALLIEVELLRGLLVTTERPSAAPGSSTSPQDDAS